MRSSPQRRRSAQRGFTLVELMVALVLFAFVTVGMLSSAVTMVRGFREQEATISTETATRSSLDYVADALRQVSPGVQALANITNPNCTTGALSALQNQTTQAPLTNTADELTMVFASGAVVTSLRTSFAESAATFKVQSITDLSVGDYLLITDFDTGHLAQIQSFGGTDAVGTTVNVTNHCITGTKTYTAGSSVVRAMRAKFRIRTQDNIPVLMMDPDAEGTAPEEPIAENIESMEIALGIDKNGDGTLTELGTAGDDDDWFGNHISDPAATAADLGKLRAVRISLVARSPREFQGVNSFVLPAIEDRAANATTDNYRRRILSTTVEVRNLGGSP